MKKWLFGVMILNIFLLGGCAKGNSEEPQTKEKKVVSASEVPTHLKKGEEMFHARCAVCHGEKAKGTDKGPTFISRIYEPNHHGDASFHLAVRNGVRAHHWQFGNMPKISGLTQEEMTHIIGYVRWLQKQAGVY